MNIKAIKTRRVLPPQDNLWQLLADYLKAVPENSIVVITSKIVSICEGRCVSIDDNVRKDDLIMQESEYYLDRSFYATSMHTITQHILIRGAGIDASNGNGYYILYPENPSLSAKLIWKWLRKTFQIKNVGVIISDSSSMPLRRGIIGISLSHYGFQPLRDYRGKKDIFGRELHFSQSNIPDSLAAAAVIEMGEGSEQCPLAIVTQVKGIEFVDKPKKSSKPYSSFEVPMEEDIFSPFLKHVPWKKGGRN